jgi:hypothetical protein
MSAFSLFRHQEKLWLMVSNGLTDDADATQSKRWKAANGHPVREKQCGAFARPKNAVHC